MSFSSLSRFSGNKSTHPAPIPSQFLSGKRAASAKNNNSTKKANKNNNSLPVLPPWNPTHNPSAPMLTPLYTPSSSGLPSNKTQKKNNKSGAATPPAQVPPSAAAPAIPVKLYTCNPPSASASAGASCKGTSCKKNAIKHERQHSLYCGQHALNNLLQGRVMFVSNYPNRANKVINGHINLSYYCDKIPGVKITDMCDPNKGYYDASVLIAALMDNGFTTEYHVQNKAAVQAEFNDPDLIGFIINKGRHYYAIVKQFPANIDNIHQVSTTQGRFMKINSSDSRPALLNAKQVGDEIKSARGIIIVKL